MVPWNHQNQYSNDIDFHLKLSNIPSGFTIGSILVIETSRICWQSGYCANIRASPGRSSRTSWEVTEWPTRNSSLNQSRYITICQQPRWSVDTRERARHDAPVQIITSGTAVFECPFGCLQFAQFGSAFGISGKLSVFQGACLCVLGNGGGDIDVDWRRIL